MVRINLSDEERHVVIETLERSLSDLSYEIADTDKMDYRDMLKQRRDHLKNSVQKLREGNGDPEAAEPRT